MERQQLAAQLQGGERIDGLMQHGTRWNQHASKPLATDPRALHVTDPSANDPIDDSLPTTDFAISHATPTWRKHHRKHCSACASYMRDHPDAYAHPQCYFRRMHHCLRTGFQPHMTAEPPLSRIANYKHSYDNWGAVEQHLEKLDSKQILSPGRHRLPPGASSLPLNSVVKETDQREFDRTGLPPEGPKTRVCADAKNSGLNDCCSAWDFRYAGPNEAIAHVQQGDELTTIDFRNFFPSLPLRPVFAHKYCWVSDPRYESHHVAHSGRPRDYRSPSRMGRWRTYRGIFFGLKVASAYASSVSGEICQILRSWGYRCSVYCDDLLLCSRPGRGQEEARRAVNLIISLGLSISEDKLQIAQPAVEYLGVIIDAKNFVISAKPATLQYAQECLRDILAIGRTTRKAMKSLVGKLSWLAHVIVGGRTYMQRMMPFAYAEGKQLVINDDFRADARWWLARLSTPEHASRIIPRDHGRTVLAMKADASGGCGGEHEGYGYVFRNNIHFAKWTPQFRSHDNMQAKELISLLSWLCNYGHLYHDSILRYGTDNAGSIFSLNAERSRRDQDTMDLLRRIADKKSEFKITIVGYHVTRLQNTLADHLTRFTNLTHLKQGLLEHGLVSVSPRPTPSGFIHPLGWAGSESKLCVRRQSRTELQ